MDGKKLMDNDDVLSEQVVIIKSIKSKIQTFNVTYDSYDNVHIVVCPKCGECIDVKTNYSNPEMCKCGYKWKIKKVAIGTLVKE